MASTNNRKWRIPVGVELHSRCWGDECVIYNAGSGDTHLLDATAARLLLLLQNESITCSDLVARLAVSSQFENDAELAAYSVDTLSELARLGLVESPD